MGVAEVILFTYLVLVTGVVGLLLYIMWHGAPYVATKPERVTAMIKLAGVTRGDRAVDLGSGDGRLVAALAKAGARAEGYEINPLLVWLSRRRISKDGLSNSTHIRTRSFWGANLSHADIITVYGMPHIMGRLERKLRRELKPGTRVVSNVFTFPSWRPAKQSGQAYLYVYSSGKARGSRPSGSNDKKLQ